MLSVCWFCCGGFAAVVGLVVICYIVSVRCFRFCVFSRWLVVACLVADLWCCVFACGVFVCLVKLRWVWGSVSVVTLY